MDSGNKHIAAKLRMKLTVTLRIFNPFMFLHFEKRREVISKQKGMDIALNACAPQHCSILFRGGGVLKQQGADVVCVRDESNIYWFISLTHP